MTDIPHFALPFRLAVTSGKTFPIVNEQDSLDDVADCVSAALHTDKGFRADMPSFGVPDPTFQVIPIDISTIQAEIQVHEPRVSLVLSEQPDRLDSLIDTIIVETSLKEGRGV